MGMAKLRGCCCLLHATTMVCIFFQSKLKWGCMSLREAPAVLMYSSTFFSTTKRINDKTWSKTNAKQSFCGRQEQKLRFGTFTGFNGFNSKLQVETFPSRQESCAMRSLSLSLLEKSLPSVNWPVSAYPGFVEHAQQTWTIRQSNRGHGAWVVNHVSQILGFGQQSCRWPRWHIAADWPPASFVSSSNLFVCILYRWDPAFGDIAEWFI